MLSIPTKASPRTLTFDMCRCDTCGDTFKVTDCIADYGHHNGWELPPYTEYYCPNCTDGVIDQFWHSDGAINHEDVK